MQDLPGVAYQLAEEIRDGKWAHVDGLRKKPVPTCPEIIDELRNRIPGHTTEAYLRAIADGLAVSR